MATDATSQATDQPKDGADTKPKKVEYTPEQQAHLDSLIKEAHSKLRQENEILKSQVGELMPKLTQLEESLKKSAEGGKPESKDLEEMNRVNQALRADAEQLAQQLKVKDELINKSNDEKAMLRKKFNMRMAASPIPFHKYELVEMMMSESVREDDKGKFYVVNDDGVTPRRNKHGEYMSLTEAFEEFAAKEKWSVKSDYVAGAGSSESNGGSGAGKYTAEQLWGKDAGPHAAALELSIKRENKTEWLRLKEEGKAKGLLGPNV